MDQRQQQQQAALDAFRPPGTKHVPRGIILNARMTRAFAFLPVELVGEMCKAFQVGPYSPLPELRAYFAKGSPLGPKERSPDAPETP